MKKIRLRLEMPVRPLFAVFCFAFMTAGIYCRMLYRYSSGLPYEGIKISMTERVNQKDYDVEGNLKSIVLGDAIVYVSGAEALTEPVLDGCVTVRGYAYSFEPVMNKGSFDTRTYYVAKGIKKYVVATKIYSVSEPLVPVRENLLAFRKNLTKRVLEACPVEGATVVTLLLGDKTYMDDERLDLYQRAGVSHFLVISGLHISALGAAAYRVIYRLFKKRAPAALFAIVMLLLYGLFIGFSVSVTRALIMYAVRLFADAINETYDMLNAASIAGVIAIISNPHIVSDTGFLYSYGTVFSIALYTTYFRKNKLSERRKDRLGAFFKLPIVLMAAMMPLSLYLSYEYCLAGILINAVLVFCTAPIMTVSVFALLFSATGLLHPAHVCDFLIAVCIKCLDAFCRLGLMLPGGCIRGKPAEWQLILYYVLLLWGTVYFKSAGGVFICMYRLALMCFVTTRLFFLPTVSMLYVGQGECIIIKTGKDTAIMVDAGSTSVDKLYEYTLLPFLKCEGISRIETVFITHGDKDHISALTDFLDDYDSAGIDIGVLAVADVDDERKGELLCQCISKANEEGISVIEVKQGDSIKVREWKFDVVWPRDNASKIYDTNELSLVMYVTCGNTDFSMLLTGDIDNKSEKEILRCYAPGKLSGCLLKVAHHGSKSATGADFLNAYSFDSAIISAGIDNVYGHPHAKTLTNLENAEIEYYVTNKCGETDIILHGNKGYEIRSMIENVIIR